MHSITIHQAIRAEGDAIWRALVDGTVTPAYYVGFGHAQLADLSTATDKARRDALAIAVCEL